jgi:membrane fusion protein, multidrug efflux system
MSKKIIKRIYNVVIILLFLGAIGWCFSHFYHGSDVAYTDDAQVNRHITPINTRVPGFIKEIRFNDYQHVKKGDTLVIIEDAEFRLHVAQAEAGLRGSKSSSSVVTASMGTTNTNVQTAAAGIEEARVDMMNAKQDFDRFAALMKKDAVTRQQYDNAYARYLGAKARYEQASSRKASAASVRNVQTQQLGGSRAGENVAEAQLNLARLNLSYTVIVATCDGVMGRKDIHEGQLVQPGQMNISSKYLTNIVNQVTGHTPKTIIDQYVILQLKMHLKRTTQSIKEMAWEFHFADVSFFCRYFKKHTGLTPQQIRS